MLIKEKNVKCWLCSAEYVFDETDKNHVSRDTYYCGWCKSKIGDAIVSIMKVLYGEFISYKNHQGNIFKNLEKDIKKQVLLRVKEKKELFDKEQNLLTKDTNKETN